jgi:hypothetical protein
MSEVGGDRRRTKPFVVCRGWFWKHKAGDVVRRSGRVSLVRALFLLFHAHFETGAKLKVADADIIVAAF